MTDNNVPVLAVYDFRSKQEFIYRTNRMREITGASELIAGMYGEFLKVRIGDLGIRDDWREASPEPLMSFTTKGGDPVFGEVVYEGGGNLLVLYCNRETFKKANRLFSKVLIEHAYSLPMICAGVDWEKPQNGEREFEHNRNRVFQELDRVKRIGGSDIPCNVLPYTQVDRLTFKPVVVKNRGVREELTQEQLAKLNAYENMDERDRLQGRFVDDLSRERGTDSLIAILYFDGNSIGERLKAAVDDGVAAGKSEVQAIRDFSLDLHKTLVENTEERIISALTSQPEERLRGYRIAIDHGDEITLMCNAHAAPFALDAYFAALEGTGYHACGGMAICHSHDPYSMVYRIAEECCESGKKCNRKAQKAAMEGLEGRDAARAARKADANYVDFHFCRAGITGTLDQIRSAQDGDLTACPYKVGGSYAAFLRVGELLAASEQITRSDIKELNRAVLRGYSWYALEYERIKTKDLDTMREIERVCSASPNADAEDVRELVKPILFDVTSLYDVFYERFAAPICANDAGERGESDAQA